VKAEPDSNDAMEIKTEADSNDTLECSHDSKSMARTYAESYACCIVHILLSVFMMRYLLFF